MMITKNAVVALTYTLRENDAEGPLVETVDEKDPLYFLYGAGNFLPKFEEHLAGKNVGDHFDFILQSEDAYGPVLQEYIGQVPIQNFMIDGAVPEELLSPGKFISMQNEAGHPVKAKIVEVGTEFVTMDFNHQMAGKNLHFTGDVLSVREASKEEIDHGHVHGPGGHDH